MQNCLSSHLSGSCRRLESALAQNLKQDCDESSLSPKQHPCVWIRSISSQNRAQAPSVPPLQEFPRCREGGAKVALGYTQALLFVETMLTCHPSVLVSDSLKHSNMPNCTHMLRASSLVRWRWKLPSTNSSDIQTAKFSFEVSNPVSCGGCFILRWLSGTIYIPQLLLQGKNEKKINMFLKTNLGF